MADSNDGEAFPLEGGVTILEGGVVLRDGGLVQSGGEIQTTDVGSIETQYSVTDGEVLMSQGMAIEGEGMIQMEDGMIQTGDIQVIDGGYKGADGGAVLAGSGSAQIFDVSLQDGEMMKGIVGGPPQIVSGGDMQVVDAGGMHVIDDVTLQAMEGSGIIEGESIVITGGSMTAEDQGSMMVNADSVLEGGSLQVLCEGKMQVLDGGGVQVVDGGTVHGMEGGSMIIGGESMRATGEPSLTAEEGSKIVGGHSILGSDEPIMIEGSQLIDEGIIEMAGDDSTQITGDESIQEMDGCSVQVLDGSSIEVGGTAIQSEVTSTEIAEGSMVSTEMVGSGVTKESGEVAEFGEVQGIPVEGEMNIEDSAKMQSYEIGEYSIEQLGTVENAGLDQGVEISYQEMPQEDTDIVVESAIIESQGVEEIQGKEISEVQEIAVEEGALEISFEQAIGSLESYEVEEIGTIESADQRFEVSYQDASQHGAIVVESAADENPVLHQEYREMAHDETGMVIGNIDEDTTIIESQTIEEIQEVQETEICEVQEMPVQAETTEISASEQIIEDLAGMHSYDTEEQSETVEVVGLDPVVDITYPECPQDDSITIESTEILPDENVVIETIGIEQGDENTVNETAPLETFQMLEVSTIVEESVEKIEESTTVLEDDEESVMLELSLVDSVENDFTEDTAEEIQIVETETIPEDALKEVSVEELAQQEDETAEETFIEEVEVHETLTVESSQENDTQDSAEEVQIQETDTIPVHGNASIDMTDEQPEQEYSATEMMTKKMVDGISTVEKDTGVDKQVHETMNVETIQQDGQSAEEVVEEASKQIEELSPTDTSAVEVPLESHENETVASETEQMNEVVVDKTGDTEETVESASIEIREIQDNETLVLESVEELPSKCELEPSEIQMTFRIGKSPLDKEEVINMQEESAEETAEVVMDERADSEIKEEGEQSEVVSPQEASQETSEIASSVIVEENKLSETSKESIDKQSEIEPEADEHAQPNEFEENAQVEEGKYESEPEAKDIQKEESAEETAEVIMDERVDSEIKEEEVQSEVVSPQKEAPQAIASSVIVEENKLSETSKQSIDKQSEIEPEYVEHAQPNEVEENAQVEEDKYESEPEAKDIQKVESAEETAEVIMDERVDSEIKEEEVQSEVVSPQKEAPQETPEIASSVIVEENKLSETSKEGIDKQSEIEPVDVEHAQPNEVEENAQVGEDKSEPEPVTKDIQEEESAEETAEVIMDERVDSEIKEEEVQSEVVSPQKEAPQETPEIASSVIVEENKLSETSEESIDKQSEIEPEDVEHAQPNEVEENAQVGEDKSEPEPDTKDIQKEESAEETEEVIMDERVDSLAQPNEVEENAQVKEYKFEPEHKAKDFQKGRDQSPQESPRSCTCALHSCASSPRYEDNCPHKYELDDLKMKVNRIEKEKEYLEGKYDQLSRDRPVMESSRQSSSRDNVEDILTPRSVRSDSHICDCHCHRANNSARSISVESDFYKAKCDEIKREKESLERKYEGEKRQRHEMEHEFQYEKNEKKFLEERYDKIIQSICRFEDTIKSLRRENEILQSNLNEWSRPQKIAPSGQAAPGFSAQTENSDPEGDMSEYRKSLEVLERENKEFRKILDSLNRKNSSQDNLMSIELGLAKEHEFLELKHEQVKLKEIIGEQKRTIRQMQEKIDGMMKEAEDEAWKLKETNRKNERKIREYQAVVDDADEVKSKHEEQIHILEMKLQREFANKMRLQNQVSELQSNIRHLEKEKERRRPGDLNQPGSLHSGEIYSDDVMELRKRYEEEQRGKVKLANDIKYLLQDIMDLKDNNSKLKDDFSKERMEIKTMLEKQANEITQVYLTQIRKLQEALGDEMRKREMMEQVIGQKPRVNQVDGQVSYGMPSSALEGIGARESENDATGIPRRPAIEERKREELEAENKNLLYEMNKLLSGMRDNDVDSLMSNTRKEDFDKGHHDNNDLRKRNKALLSDVEELREQVEDMDGLVKKNKQLKIRNDDLQDELVRATRKSDDLLSTQRNLTRDIDHLTMKLDDVQRNNRQYADEVDRLLKKIQDIEDSFKKERSQLVQDHENDKARVIEDLKRKYQDLEHALQRDEGRYRDSGNLSKGSDYIGIAGNERNRSARTGGDHASLPYPASSLQDQVNNLEQLLEKTTRKHEDELKNIQSQKKFMREDFEREKRSLRDCFDREKAMFARQVQQMQGRNAGVRSPSAARKNDMYPGGDHETITASNADIAHSEYPGDVIRKASAEENYLTPGDDMEIPLNSYEDEWQGGNRASRREINPASFADAAISSDKYGGSEMHLMPSRSSNLHEGSGRRDEDSSNNFERKVREVEEQFSKNKSDILERASNDKWQFQKEMDSQLGKTFEDIGRSYESELNRLGYHEGEASDERRRMGVGEQNKELEKAHRDVLDMRSQLEQQKQEYEEKLSKVKMRYENATKNMASYKKALTTALQSMKKEVSVLKCERKELRCSKRSELDKIVRQHEVEKLEISENFEKRRKEETSKLEAEYQDRTAKEKRHLQKTIDDLYRKMTTAEGRIKNTEAMLDEEKHRLKKERMEFQRSLARNQEKLKSALHSEYRKMVANEKKKFDKTLLELKQQIASLQEQRKEIQEKLLSKESSGLDKISRERLMLQMEQDFLDKLEKEKRPLKEQIGELKEELSKAKREHTTLKNAMGREKADLESEVDRVKDDMKVKLQKAREEFERRADLSRMESKSKSIAAVSDYDVQNQSQVNPKHYQEQINLLEQRNITLQSQNERLEREVKMLLNRVTTLEDRGLSSYSAALSPPGRHPFALEQHDRGLHSMESAYSSIRSLNLESSIQHANEHPGHYLPSTDSYRDILDRVRDSMQNNDPGSGALGSGLSKSYSDLPSFKQGGMPNDFSRRLGSMDNLGRSGISSTGYPAGYQNNTGFGGGSDRISKVSFRTPDSRVGSMRDVTGGIGGGSGLPYPAQGSQFIQGGTIKNNSDFIGEGSAVERQGGVHGMNNYTEFSAAGPTSEI